MPYNHTLFDDYGLINESRKNFLQEVLPPLIAECGLNTALDVGCGIGFYSQWLSEVGMEVKAFDARSQNVQEAKERYPDVEFYVDDIEKPKMLEVGASDLVLCFGLLYHLENPFLAIRHLNTLAKKISIIESMIAPYSSPSAVLIDEMKRIDQALNYVAFVPSEPCLVKMIYRAGFSYVYRVAPLPNHTDFRTTLRHRRRRTILVASKSRLSHPTFRELREASVSDVWERRSFRIIKKIKALRTRLVGS
jgi:SAM-dependent methyltransferase